MTKDWSFTTSQFLRILFYLFMFWQKNFCIFAFSHFRFIAFHLYKRMHSPIQSLSLTPPSMFVITLGMRNRNAKMQKKGKHNNAKSQNTTMRKCEDTINKRRNMIHKICRIVAPFLSCFRIFALLYFEA